MLFPETACAIALTAPSVLAASCCVLRDCETNLIIENPRVTAVSKLNDCHTLIGAVLSLAMNNPSDKLCVSDLNMPATLDMTPVIEIP